MPFTVCIRIPREPNARTSSSKLVDLRENVSHTGKQQEEPAKSSKGKAKDVGADELEYVSSDGNGEQNPTSSGPGTSVDTAHRPKGKKTAAKSNTQRGRPDAALAQAMRLIDPYNITKLVKDMGIGHQSSLSNLQGGEASSGSTSQASLNAGRLSDSPKKPEHSTHAAAVDALNSLSFQEAEYSDDTFKAFENIINAYEAFAMSDSMEGSEAEASKDLLLSTIRSVREVAQERFKDGRSLLRVHEAPDCWCHAFPMIRYRQSTQQFMALEIMDMKDQPAFAPRLAHDFESIFYVLLWTGLGARGGRKVHRNCTNSTVFPYELRSNRSFDTIKQWKLKFYFDPSNGRSIVNDIQFTDPNAMNFALGLYDLFRCSTLGHVHNTFARQDLVKKREAVPGWLAEHCREDVPPGAMLYFTGARQSRSSCRADCCRTHWARWAKRMNMRIFPYDVSVLTKD